MADQFNPDWHSIASIVTALATSVVALLGIGSRIISARQRSREGKLAKLIERDPIERFEVLSVNVNTNRKMVSVRFRNRSDIMTYLHVVRVEIRGEDIDLYVDGEGWVQADETREYSGKMIGTVASKISPDECTLKEILRGSSV